MVVVKKMKKIADNFDMEIYVDEIAELPSDGKISGYKVSAGSVAYDKTGAVAIMDSEGSWNVV